MMATFRGFTTCAYHPRRSARVTDARGWWLCEDCAAERGVEPEPPEVDYPEDHSPYCHKDCDHPCHEPYDRWVAQRAVGSEGDR